MKFFIIIFLFITINILGQNVNTKLFDSKFNDSLLVGTCNLNAFSITPYNEWYDKEYTEYIPSDSIINLMINKLDDTKITIVLGVWCSDSRREFPRFIKILNLIKFNKENINIICVNTKKDAVLFDISEYKINLVPTFIIYKNNKEIGRIEETPKVTLESDLYSIFSLIK